MATQAAGEAVGQLLEALGPGPPPGLVCLLATPAHRGAIEDIARTVRVLLAPRILIGSVAQTIATATRTVENGPAIVAWAARVRRAEAVVLAPGGAGRGHEAGEGRDGDDVGSSLAACVARLEGPPTGALVLGDAATFPARPFLAAAAGLFPDAATAGGLIGAPPTAPGAFIAHDTIVDGGGVVALVGGDAAMDAVASEGSRPIGQPMVVTASAGDVIYELAGAPALRRIDEQLQALGPDERALAAAGVDIGIAVREPPRGHRSGDFVVRRVLGPSPRGDGLVVTTPVPVGTCVQFHLRDPEAARRELADRINAAASVRTRRGEIGAALVFTSRLRDPMPLHSPLRDVATIADTCGPVALAAVSCAAEIGPSPAGTILRSRSCCAALFGSHGQSMPPDWYRVAPAAAGADRPVRGDAPDPGDGWR